MSSVYIKEPEFTGKVVLDTTHGPVEIQLWCRECRETTKLFLQLCLDGFYDGMLFHRIVPGFLIQTGAVRQKKQCNVDHSAYLNEKNGMEALERRRFETQSRIRFSHRGQVSMALEVNQDDPDHALQPQFFITLDEAPYLDGKHVVFGSITGPTIFNAIRMGQHEVNDDNAPVDMEDAPRIKSVKIVENQLHTDINPTTDVPWKVADEPAKKKKKKRKGKLDINVLSFGDEMGDTEVHASKPKKKQKMESKKEPAHDAADVDTEAEKAAPEAARLVEKPTFVSKDTAPAPPQQAKAEEDLKQPKEKPPKKKKSYVEDQRAKYAARSNANKRKRQTDTMDKLLAFQAKVKTQVTTSRKVSSKGTMGDNSLASRMARRAQTEQQGPDETDMERDPTTYHGQVLEDDADERGSAWLATKFQCRKHMDHGEKELAGDGRSANDYEVVDSRQDGKDRKEERHHDHKKKKKKHKTKKEKV